MRIFFFKQKTAYELRISDLSSDVCSSDLGERLRGGRSGEHALLLHGLRGADALRRRLLGLPVELPTARARHGADRRPGVLSLSDLRARADRRAPAPLRQRRRAACPPQRRTPGPRHYLYPSTRPPPHPPPPRHPPTR